MIFLPFPNYEAVAYALDEKRLCEQRFEVLSALRDLSEGNLGKPWVKMWRGHEGSLLMLQEALLEEWVHNFGKEDGCYEMSSYRYFRSDFEGDLLDDPPWLGDDALHVSHQSNLVRIDPDYYAKQFHGVPDDLPYIWPI